MTATEIEQRINEIRHLEPGWGIDDSKPIPKEVCDKAERMSLLFTGAKYMTIFPTMRESINIETENNGAYFEIEIFANRYTTLAAEHNNAGHVGEMFPTPKEKQTSDKDEWININKSNNAETTYQCNKCKFKVKLGPNLMLPQYCPNCGTFKTNGHRFYY